MCTVHWYIDKVFFYTKKEFTRILKIAVLCVSWTNYRLSGSFWSRQSEERKNLAVLKQTNKRLNNYAVKEE